MAGYGRILHMTRDEWPRYICCVLTVHDDLIRTDRPLVQRLVDHVMSAGFWLEVGDRNRFTAADIAAAPAVFNQRPEIIRHVLSNPRDRVTYADLRLIRSEFDELMQMALDAGVLARPVAYETYVDDSFARKARPVDIRVP